ncbi:MAG: glycosyltransferase [Glaciimonas sp.]|nr:glycosyltransferase [Glaciimonas sp.]
MRILHFYKTYYPDTWGGIEQVIRQLCNGTSQLGAVNRILTLTAQRQGGELVVDGQSVLRLPQDFEIASTGFALRAIPVLARLAAQVDVVHYHFPWPFMDLAHFMARVKTPSVVTYHSDIIRQKNLLRLYRPLRDRFLHSVDKIVATSPNYLASSEVLQRYPDKTEMITYGLDQASYPQAKPENLQAWRSRLAPRFFLFVGVLRYYKGLHILLEALRGLDYPVVIAGGGPEEQALKQLAGTLGLKNLIFTGVVSEPDKAALLQLCYAFVFPSHLRSEAFGISLLEAAMAGKPMITCEIGTGISYVNVDGETGLCVAPTPQAVRAALTRLWQAPSLASDMGQRAVARYQAVFTAQHMAQKYMTLYSSLLGKQRAFVPAGSANLLKATEKN